MVDRRDDPKISHGLKNSLEKASPVKITQIDEKMHVTMEVGVMIRIAVAVAIGVAGYTKFMFEQQQQAVEIDGLRGQIEELDHLLRKDFQTDIDAITKDLSTVTGEISTARETDSRETNTRIETEVATLAAAIGGNSATLEAEIQSLGKSIQDVNRTTHAELKPLITNLTNMLMGHIEAFGQRIDKIENLQTEQVKVGLFGRRKQ